MDTVTLWLTSKLIHSPIKAKRCAACAGLGAFISTVLTASEANWIINLIVGIAMSLIMCLIAFGFGGLLGFVKRCAVLWTVGMVLGGVMTFLLSRGTYSRVYTNGMPQTESSVHLLPIAVGLSAVFVYFLRRVSRKRTVRVYIDIDSDTVETCGIVDSGNFLRDPISGDGVIIIRRDLLPCALRELDVLDLTSIAERRLEGRIRLIPAAGIGGSTLLVAIRPDKVMLDGREVRCLVALTDGKEGTNKCIVPESIM